MMEKSSSHSSAHLVQIVCPECGFSKDVPSQAIPANKKQVTCPKCACRFLLPEISSSQNNSSPSSELPPIRSASTAVIKIKFQTFLGRDTRFTGKGTIQVQADKLEVTGRRRFFRFGRNVEQYPLTALRNVTRKGKVVSFAVSLGKGRWQALLVCPDESTAVTLVDCLPAATDTQLFTHDQAQKEFKKQLEQLPKGTPAAWSLLTLLCLAYLVVAWGGGQWFQFEAPYLATVGGNFPPYTIDGQWWRMLSATFLHGGLIHLAFNAYALYHFGILAERLYGFRAFLAIYFLAGFVGSCGTLLASPSAVGVGASGAIFGIIGALLAFFLTDKEFLNAGVRNKLVTNFTIFAVYALLSGFRTEGIDNAAHIGGFLTGLILGWFTGAPPRVRKDSSGWVSRKVLAGFCLVLIGAGVAIAAAPQSNVNFQTHVAMLELLKDIGARETTMSENLEHFRAKGAEATDDDLEMLLQQMRTVYEGDTEQLMALHPKTRGLEERRDLLLRYITLKQEVNGLFAEYFERTDSELIETAKQKLAEAKELASEFSEPVKWGS
jgi:membrane associated rhomboid family serine protease